MYHRKAGGGVAIAGHHCLQVEKQILGLGAGGAGCEHCQRGLHLTVEDCLRGLIAHVVLIVVEAGEHPERVAATIVERGHEERRVTAAPVLREPPAILKRVAACDGILQPGHSALICCLSVLHELHVVEHAAGKVVFCPERRGYRVEAVPVSRRHAEWIFLQTALLEDVERGEIALRHIGEIPGSAAISLLAQSKRGDDFIEIRSVGAGMQPEVPIERRGGSDGVLHIDELRRRERVHEPERCAAVVDGVLPHAAVTHLIESEAQQR